MSQLSSFSQTHFFSNLPGMEYQYIFGGILAYILVFVLYNFAEKKKSSGSMEVDSKEFEKASENGTCPQEAEGSAEIIIVGAGVAGAALAYTLGKVEIFLSIAFHLYDNFFELSYMNVFCSIDLFLFRTLERKRVGRGEKLKILFDWSGSFKRMREQRLQILYSLVLLSMGAK